MNLLCFAFAGGSVLAYGGLKQALKSRINVQTFELPGRGARAREPLIRNMDEVLDDYGRQIQPFLDEPFAFFGHSMGALVAHLLVGRLKSAGRPLPQHLFLSAKAAPGTTDRREPKYRLAEAAFRRYIQGLGGCPPEVLADEEMMGYFSALLRADFEIIETCDEGLDIVHDIPVTVFAGADDAIREWQINHWQRTTHGPVQIHTFSGDHFFILHHWQDIAAIITSKISGTAVVTPDRVTCGTAPN